MLKSLIQRMGDALGLHIESKRGIPWGAYKYLDIKALSGELRVVFDVGANVGQTVREVKSYFPDTKIFAFEPVPETYAKLRASVGNLAGVKCFENALGATQAVLQMTTQSDGQNTLNVHSRPDEKRVAVKVDTIDDFAASKGIGRIDLLKIDTEGYEMEVLKGASGMLSNGRIPFVLAECDFIRRPSEPHGDFFQITEMLFGHGYRLVATYVHGVDGDGWRWGDALFMRPAARSVSCSPYATGSI